MSSFKPVLITNEDPQPSQESAGPVRIRLRAAGEEAPPRQQDQIYDGRFRLQTCLERRGGIEKWLALKEPMVRRVYLEVLTESGERADAFLMDAGALAQIKHVNLCKVFDLGRSDDGSTWRSLEVMHGLSLRELLNKGPMARNRLRALVRDVVDGMAALHSSGVIHGNLTAEAVLLEQDVDDEEVARITAFGTHGAANPALRTPEDQTDTMAADVWAIGLLIHQAATGKRPRNGRIDENLPDGLRQVVEGCLAPVEQRYPDALAVQKALPFRSVEVSSDAAPPPPMVMPGTTLGPATSTIIEPPAIEPVLPAPAAAQEQPQESAEPESFAQPWLMAVASGLIGGLVAGLVLKMLTS